jgi:DUF4097 and DUF4098 domain-containing protein YvlB
MKLAAALLSSAAFLYGVDGAPFEWRGSIPTGRTLEVKGVNGEIRIEPSTGSEVQVSARITARRSDPNDVRVEVVPGEGGDVRICSVYPTNDGPVGCAGRGNIRDNDTKVNFTVRLPRGVRMSARNVNGDIVGRGLNSPLEARTVNGRVEIATTEAASAQTVNGEILADFGPLGESSDFATVNGSITLGLPPTANANVQASVVNGTITPDFPLTLTGTISRKKINGRLNNGGPVLSVKTVNGSINIKRSGSVI